MQMTASHPSAVHPPRLLASQTSMSGIAVSEDAVNLFYLMRLKATVGGCRCAWVQGGGAAGECRPPRAPQGHSGAGPGAAPAPLPPPPLPPPLPLAPHAGWSTELKEPALPRPCTTPAVQVGALAGGRQRAAGAPSAARSGSSGVRQARAAAAAAAAPRALPQSASALWCPPSVNLTRGRRRGPRCMHPAPPGNPPWPTARPSIRQVIIAAVGGKDDAWADFLAALPDADCRYGGECALLPPLPQLLCNQVLPAAAALRGYAAGALLRGCRAGGSQCGAAAAGVGCAAVCLQPGLRCAAARPVTSRASSSPALPPLVFDFDFTTPDGQKLHKMVFLNW